MGNLAEEIDCITQSQNGDHAAFEALIQKHQQMIHTLAYRMTGSVSDAQDLAQETFIRAYQQLDAFNGASKFSSWLYRIAVNACIDWQRKESRRVQLGTQWVEEYCSDRQNPSTDEALDELSRGVQAALMKLPEKQRAAIALTVYGGHNHAEAAKILGCSETTVSWRIFSARQKLKKLLSKAGGCYE